MFCPPALYSDPCPPMCSCLLLSLLCRGVNLTGETNLEPYTAVTLINVSLTDVSIVLDTLGQPIFLIIRHSHLLLFCKQTKQMEHLMMLDLSNNIVEVIKTKCFQKISNIDFLNASLNRLYLIEKCAYCGSIGISQLDLSWNNLSSLQDSSFASLHALLFLQVTQL